MRWEVEARRKLYTRVDAPWLCLDLSARGLADELIRCADDSGFVALGLSAEVAADPVAIADELGRVLGARSHEKERLRRDVEQLLAPQPTDPFATVAGSGLRIHAFGRGQGRGPRSSAAERQARFRDKRGVTEGVTGGVTSTVTEGVTGGVTEGVTGGVTEGVTGGVTGGVTEGVTGGVTGGVTSTVTEGVTSTVADALRPTEASFPGEIQPSDTGTGPALSSLSSSLNPGLKPPPLSFLFPDPESARARETQMGALGEGSAVADKPVRSMILPPAPSAAPAATPPVPEASSPAAPKDAPKVRPGPGPRAASPAPLRAVEPAKASDDSFAHEFLWAAWHRGVAKATGREPTYDDRQRPHLDRLVKAYAKGPQGKPLPLDERETWAERTAVAFVEATRAKPTLWSGWSPEACSRWENMGRPTDGQSARPTDMRQPRSTPRPGPKMPPPVSRGLQDDFDAMDAAELAAEGLA